MLNTPFAPWPSFTSDEADVVQKVLLSNKVNYWTGDEGRQFESEFAAYTGCSHALAVANGTLALELALQALGIGHGDEVITTSRTFIASASCAVARGARPVTVDVDPVSQNLTADTVRAALTPRTRAIIAVHLAGWPCDLDPLLGLAHQHGLKLIEDCAQAHGARYKGRPVGSFGDAAAFSFCQDKIMTTGGEGGMLTTSDPEVWERAWSYRDHGKSFDAVFNRSDPPGFRWLHESFGSNFRLTEMQSAIGRVQLRKLDAWVAIRRRHAAALNNCFRDIPALRVTVPDVDYFHSYYKYYVFVRPEQLWPGWNRDRIMEAINTRGIPCFSGSCSEIYLEKAFAGKSWGPEERYPSARQLGETSLMFLVHPTLSDASIDATCRAVAEVLAEAGLS